jgi:hypothetical protein
MNNKVQYTNLYPTAFLYTSIFKNYIVQLNIPCVITLCVTYLYTCSCFFFTVYRTRNTRPCTAAIYNQIKSSVSGIIGKWSPSVSVPTHQRPFMRHASPISCGSELYGWVTTHQQGVEGDTGHVTAGHILNGSQLLTNTRESR